MAQMAGSNAIKGTITPDSVGTVTINFGKTLNKYLWFLEMTDASKTSLLASGINLVKAYANIGAYPMPGISSDTPSKGYFTYRVNPSTQAYTTSTYNYDCATSTGLTFGTCEASTNYANYLYVGYTYNYTIIPID